eukprot:COSAG02_NODE_40589_length_403_cov_13.529605_1_plen_57_part_01
MVLVLLLLALTCAAGAMAPCPLIKREHIEKHDTQGIRAVCPVCSRRNRLKPKACTSG